MDAMRFDRLTRALIHPFSRRNAVGGIVAGLGLTALHAPASLEAKKKRGNKKRKRLQRNAFGCVNVGQACRGNSVNCCSGICEGTKPKKGKKDASRCVAHNVGECQADQDICAGVEAACGDGGACFRTTGNASFCGDGGQCVPCQKDEDCEAFGFLDGAACVVCTEECQGINGGTACFRAGI